jgi:hypothetical protein
MKRRGLVLLLAGSLSLTTSCQDFLDVNTNPNGPETVSPNLYLPPLIHWLATAPQFDGRYITLYTQQLHHIGTAAPATTWGRMGYDPPPSDNGGQLWREVYWTFGQNLIDMMTKAEAEERWDLLGVGYVLKAWGWQALTSVYGEIIVKEAIDPSKFSFNYDTQEFAYQEALRLLDLAIENLNRTDGAVDATYLARGDKMYSGDRTKWLKFAYGLRAMTLNHFTNKSTYRPADVIAAVDASFGSSADDALMTFPGASTDNADLNFLGRTRGNFFNYRQTRFIVDLMNGTQFGGVVDPRISRMLVPDSLGTTIRGLDPNVLAFGALTVPQRPNNPHNFTGTGGVQQPGHYLFSDQVRGPVMTYAQLQFVKAEAAFRAGDRATALTAYRNALSAHIDFVNARNAEDGQKATQITAAEKATFLASPEIVPAASNLTLTHIMSQKYIAQWGWAHTELWMDMRRYHYTDVDPASGRQVYPGFAIPTTLYGDNGGKPVQRIRPRYNSEYVWNRPGLDAIGGLAADYHTKPLWITQP